MDEHWDYAFESYKGNDVGCSICNHPKASWKIEIYPNNLEKYDCAYTCNIQCLGKYLQKKGFKP